MTDYDYNEAFGSNMTDYDYNKIFESVMITDDGLLLRPTSMLFYE
jgi:hypothetical protein